MFGLHSTKPPTYSVDDWIKDREERAQHEMRERVRLTTLAMRAARFGLESLSAEDRRDLMRFTGFDFQKYEALMAEGIAVG